MKKKEKKIFDSIRKPTALPTRVFKDKKKQKFRDRKYKKEEKMREPNLHDIAQYIANYLEANEEEIVDDFMLDIDNLDIVDDYAYEKEYVRLEQEVFSMCKIIREGIRERYKGS